MSMYQMVHGTNKAGGALVGLLEAVQPLDVGRYRDAWVEHEGDRLLIRVHTRNGGGNREDYDDPSMSAHPWYVRDEDTGFDNTYADYWFAVDLGAVVPETGRALVEMAEAPVDTAQRWRDVIAALKESS